MGVADARVTAAVTDGLTAEASTGEAVERIRELFRAELRAEAHAWETGGGVPASVFERLGDIGAWEARWPERGRGPGDLTALEVIVREMSLASLGGAIAMGTHMEAYFRALARCEFGEEAWADALAGRRSGALAVTERPGGSNPTNCETVAERDGDGWVISGHKHYCSNLKAATDFVAFTRTGRGPRELSNYTLFVIPADAPGVTFTPHQMVASRASSTSMIDLEGVRVGSERCVGRPGTGLMLLLELLRGERLGAGIGGLAIAELCYEMALGFANGRETGNGRLRNQQVIAHRLADLACEIAAGRALMRERLGVAQQGRINSAQAAQCKYVLQRLAFRAADTAVQILGGRGFTDETPLAQIWRDCRVGRVGGGTDEVQLEIISQGMKPGELADHPAVRAAVGAAGE